MSKPMGWEESRAILAAESSRVLSGNYRRALQSVVAAGRTVDLLDVLADDRDNDATNLNKRGVDAAYMEGRRDGYRKAVDLLREALGETDE